MVKKVQVGNGQEKAQSENDPHSKNRDGKKTQAKGSDGRGFESYQICFLSFFFFRAIL